MGAESDIQFEENVIPLKVFYYHFLELLRASNFRLDGTNSNPP